MVAPDGAPLPKLNSTSSTDSVSTAVNERVFPSSMVLSEIDFKAKTKSGTRNTLSPSYSSLIVTPSFSFCSSVNAVAK